MIVVHVLLAGATRYDRSCAAIDFGAGTGTEHVLFAARAGTWVRDGEESSFGELSALLRSGNASLLHLHGSATPPARLLTGLKIPWISDRDLPLPRSLFRRIPPAAFSLAARDVPEVAAEEWFVNGRPRRRPDRPHVGSYARDDASRNNAEQARGRILRFRDDIEWTIFDRPPSPAELSALDLWVDPAGSEDDFDGMVVEALACLTPVVAARTARNARRLEDGRAGLLPPAGDHNEMTHAILNILFKQEVALPLRIHAEAIRDSFRPARRRAALARIYAEVTG